jgi:hypothetical protein
MIVYSLVRPNPKKRQLEALDWENDVVPHLGDDLRHATTLDILASSTHTIFSVVEKHLPTSRLRRIRVFLRSTRQSLQRVYAGKWKAIVRVPGCEVQAYKAPHNLLRAIIFNMDEQNAWGYVNLYQINRSTAGSKEFQIVGQLLPVFRVDMNSDFGRHFIQVCRTHVEYYIAQSEERNKAVLKS